MKKLVFACLMAAVAGAWAAGTPEQEAWLKKMLKEEKGVVIKDAVWMNERSLYVGVIDDGTQRDGLAQAVCEDAKKYGAEMVIVARKGKFGELGKYWCKMGRAG